MKRLLITASLLVCASFLNAQNVPYKVVFDLTSKDTNDHKMVIRWMSEISKTRPDAQLEVVLYGQSLDMVTKDKTVAASAIQELSANKNLSFKVCQVTMNRYRVDKSQLVPGVAVVPDGIYEIITRQKEGWGYIKATH
jgi:intracellular sulfur oxidation DsrE/DsrF family protein